MVSWIWGRGVEPQGQESRSKADGLHQLKRHGNFIASPQYKSGETGCEGQLCCICKGIGSAGLHPTPQSAP